MIAAAVNYARDKGEPPAELELVSMVDRFGPQAVLGRALLSRREALRWVYLEQVVRAVRLFDRTQDMGQLMQQQPELFKLAKDSIDIAIAYG